MTDNIKLDISDKISKTVSFNTAVKVREIPNRDQISHQQIIDEYNEFYASSKSNTTISDTMHIQILRDIAKKNEYIRQKHWQLIADNKNQNNKMQFKMSLPKIINKMNFTR